MAADQCFKGNCAADHTFAATDANTNANLGTCTAASASGGGSGAAAVKVCADKSKAKCTDGAFPLCTDGNAPVEADGKAPACADNSVPACVDSSTALCADGTAPAVADEADKKPAAVAGKALEGEACDQDKAASGCKEPEYKCGKIEADAAATPPVVASQKCYTN